MPEVEQNTRYSIDTILKNEGWILDNKNKNKNVFFETDIFHIIHCEALKKSKLRPDYVLVDATKAPLAVIEAKASGKNLDHALE